VAQLDHHRAVGDVVSGDDVIETVADGAVVIELRHNGVRWSLGANQSKQVSQSMAWQAPRATVVASASSGDDGDRDTAAGRHAERTAANTAESAVISHDDKAPPAVAAAGSAAPPAADHAEHKAPVAHTTAKKSPPPPPTMQPDSDAKPGGDLQTQLNEVRSHDNVRIGDEGGGGSIGAIGTGSGTGSGSASPVPAAHVTIVSGGDLVVKYTARFTGCYKSVLAEDASASGKVTITFTVAADGTVSDVSVDASGSVAGVHDCIVGALRGAKLAAQASESEESVVLELKHD
jgi:hypothetical protein